MLTSYLKFFFRFHRWAFAAAFVAGLGCHDENEVTCPAVLESCPATLPTNGARCSPRGSATLCEYGDDPWADCNTIAYCDSQGGWYIVASREPNCPSTLASGCAASYAEAMSGSQNCATAPYGQLTCRYPEGYCSCMAAGSVNCTTPAAAGCPATRPRAGDGVLRSLHHLGQRNLRWGEHEVPVRDLAADSLRQVKRAAPAVAAHRAGSAARQPLISGAASQE